MMRRAMCEMARGPVYCYCVSCGGVVVVVSRFNHTECISQHSISHYRV